MSQANRVETMAEKLVTYARRASVDDVEIVERAYWAAVAPRLQYLPDVFHHDMLHPARTALTLLEQGQCRRGAVLAAGALTETLTRELRLPRESAEALGGDVAALSAAVPNPLDDEEQLVEALVTASDDVALIAVAERLDHARHLHMRDRSLWRPFFEQTLTIYLPLASRVSQPLFQRFERWAGAFEKRLSRRE